MDKRDSPAQGALAGLRVLEFQGAGPVPFCGMLLADMGADVVVVAREPAESEPYGVVPERDVLQRGKRRVPLDLKSAQGRDAALQLAAAAQVLLEGFRPGVMERLGLGPLVVMPRAPSLVYARVSGYGQHGPLAQEPGHDINFLAASGALHAMGDAGGVPRPPLNLVADFGGAGGLCASAVLAAVLQVRMGGAGQVLDVSMLQSTRLLMASICSWRASGLWNDERGTNFLDGSCPWYAVYRAADACMLAVAALEPRFYASLLRVLGLQAFADAQWDRACWPALERAMREEFARAPRSHWLRLFAAQAACVNAVEPLPPLDAPAPDGWFVAGGVLQPQGLVGAVAASRAPQRPLSSALTPQEAMAAWAQPAQ